MHVTPRYSVCVPVGKVWAELSEHRDLASGQKARTAALLTEPDAVLWDWRTNSTIDLIQKELP